MQNAYYQEWVLSNQAGDAVFLINDTKLYVPVVTLSKEDNKDFIEQQNKGFQQSIYWNEYNTKVQTENADANVFKYINLDPSFQGVNRLFIMAYNRGAGQPAIDKNIIYQELILKNIMLLLMEEIFMIIQSKAILKNIEN